MSTFDWGPEKTESPEDTEEALAKVRHGGEKKLMRRRSAIAGVSTTAVALVAVLGLVGVGQNSEQHGQIAGPVVSTTTPEQTTPTSSPALDLAAQVTKTAADALAGLKSLGASETVTRHAISLPDYKQVDETRTADYRTSADGRFWETFTSHRTGWDGTVSRSYSPTTGESLRCENSKGTIGLTTDGVVECQRNWADDRTDWNYGLQPTSELRALVAAVVNAPSGTNRRVNESKFEGSAVYQLEYDTTAPFSQQPMHVAIVVNKESGFPIQAKTEVAGKPDTEITLRNLQINPTFTDQQLTVVVPKGQELVDATRIPAAMSLQLTFGNRPVTALRNRIPVTTASGFATNEVWSRIDATKSDYNGGCDSHDVNVGTVDMLTQESRAGLLQYRMQTIDLASCPNPASVKNVIDDFGNSRKVATIVADEGVMKDTSFDVYLQPDRSLFVYGKSKSLLTYGGGDLTIDDVRSLVNSYNYDNRK